MHAAAAPDPMLLSDVRAAPPSTPSTGWSAKVSVKEKVTFSAGEDTSLYPFDILFDPKAQKVSRCQWPSSPPALARHLPLALSVHDGTVSVIDGDLVRCAVAMAGAQLGRHSSAQLGRCSCQLAVLQTAQTRVFIRIFTDLLLRCRAAPARAYGDESEYFDLKVCQLALLVSRIISALTVSCACWIWRSALAAHVGRVLGTRPVGRAGVRVAQSAPSPTESLGPSLAVAPLPTSNQELFTMTQEQ